MPYTVPVNNKIIYKLELVHSSRKVQNDCTKIFIRKVTPIKNKI